MEAIQKQMKTNGFFYIFILRILPVNFDVISYAAGLSKVRPMTYFWRPQRASFRGRSS